MEGYLNKWTNYLSGWKPRYFVLKQGILSYYLSSEEVGAGCRGSVRIVHCRTVSHPYDYCRLDIILPSKQSLYLRASTASERQQWLIALANSKIEGEGTMSEVAASMSKRREGDAKLLKERRHDLHLTRQMLLRQITALKKQIDSVTQDKTGDIQKVRALGLLASTTCDNFLTSLDDCITITDRLSLQSADIPVLDTITSLPSPSGSPSLPSPSGSPSLPHLPSPVSSPPHPPTRSSHPEVVSRERPAYLYPLLDLTTSQLDSKTPTTGPRKELCPNSPNEDITNGSVCSLTTSLHCDTLLSKICTKVVTIMPPSNPEQILIEPFISTAGAIPELIITSFGQFLTPISSDLLSNIDKISSKYTQYGRVHTTLQQLLLAEMEREEHLLDTSARAGVLWVNRTLHFVEIFSDRFSENNVETAVALSAAYNASLMQHHNLLVRGLFALFLQQAPPRAGTLLSLCKGELDRETAMLQQLKLISNELSKITHQLHQFYDAHGLT